MLALTILLTLGLSTATSIPSVLQAFRGPTRKTSVGSEVTCIAGGLPISINSINTRILLAQPKNQFEATEIFQELLQANSTIVARTNGGNSTLIATYNISATFCYPSDATRAAQVKTVQLLTHGVGLDQTYWNIAPNYSYVSAAVEAGYAILNYDRLGVGASDHPDPIQAVQAFADVEILHGLAQLLRTGKPGLAPAVKRVVGVGHSYGSIVTEGVTAKYPADFDAVILTGFGPNLAALPSTILANDPAIAALNQPERFGALPYGYLVHNDAIAYQLPFFRYPNFSPDGKFPHQVPCAPYATDSAVVFTLSLSNKQTYTIGQEFTIPAIVKPSTRFTGPVDAVLGQNDFPFCLGDCTFPTDQSIALITSLYPSAAAGSQHFLVPNTGHVINAHFGATQAFKQQLNFLRVNNL